MNGVLGLGVKDYSVPSLLAKAKLAANSFSICFGRVIGVVGRISFGDKGYTDQSETPFISVEPRYKLSSILPSPIIITYLCVFFTFLNPKMKN